MQLVLSIFPGIDLLGRAFEEVGFCVVRGPDVLWGGDIRTFHPPAGKFAGLIGGPPCKRFSSLAAINKARYGEEALAPNLIPEFERCVAEARPQWFVMENVRRAPLPIVPGYIVNGYLVNNRWFGAVQNRVRRFSFGTIEGLTLSLERVSREEARFEPAVTANSGGRRSIAVRDKNGRMRGHQGEADWARLQRRPIGLLCELQGLPAEYLDNAPFTAKAKREVIANGVPLAMGRAIANAVKVVFEKG